MSNWAWAANPLAVAKHFRQHRYLLWQLARREVQVRYRGSWLGPVWSLLTPLLMLAVYTFVFSVVFQTRWSADEPASRADVALALFASLATFGLFAETVGAAPSLILANTNYVKRVVFPLEILPVARLLSNLVQFGFSLAILLPALLLCRGQIHWTILLLPLALLPLCLLSLGCAFFFSALGVFIRDVGQVIGLGITMLMFLSAVFYPVSSLPPNWRPLMAFNPVANVIEDVRRVTLQGLPPCWNIWAATTCFGALATVLGLMWFIRSKNAFADVL
jgi:lipopolysaccharide transport system permease protein